jgi:DNA-binding transcriptional LysR family regulator
MLAMRDVHLRNIDLNLLVPLYVLLEEKQVTRAARRSFLSQPAMSRALDRLREMFGDPLLIRSGRTYERTVAGDRVLRSLQSLLPRLEGMVRGEEFDPARSSERFRVAMTDHASTILLPALMERLRATATNVRVETSTWNDRIYHDVAAGRIDTALSAETPPAELDAEVLYEESFICLVCRARYKGTRRFTLKQYLALPHAIVETWAGMQTPVDRPLAELGLKRTAVLRIPFFVPTILSVARTDLVLTVPRRLGRIAVKMAAVREIEPPREIKGFSYFLAWHPRLAAERAHVWFRDQVRMAARSL